MNFTKKLTLAASAILLTSTFAMAQIANEVPQTAADKVTFSVSVEQIAAIKVYNSALGGKTTNTAYVDSATTPDQSPLIDNTAAWVTTQITGATSYETLRTLIPLAGIIEVKTNLISWDVTLIAANGGRLYRTVTSGSAGIGQEATESGEYLKANGYYTGNLTTDARLLAHVCFLNDSLVTHGTLLTGDCDNDIGTVNGNIPLNGTPDQEIKLSSALNKTSFGVDDVGKVSKYANFALYAALPFTEAELSGNGTYEESFTFVLEATY